LLIKAFSIPSYSCPFAIALPEGVGYGIIGMFLYDLFEFGDWHCQAVLPEMNQLPGKAGTGCFDG